MDEFSDPDFGDLFEEFANFATFPLATSLSSTLGTPSFPVPFQHSFCPHRHSVNNSLRDSLASTSSASRNLFDHFDSSSAANTRVGASSFGSSSRSGHPANPSIATSRQPLASSQSFPRNELPLTTQSSRAIATCPTQIITSQNGLPGPFTHFSDPDHDFFLNEFLGRDFSSPPPFLHRDPFNLPTTSAIAESSTAGARSSSSRTNENNLGIKREDDTQPTPPVNSGTRNEMPGRHNKGTSGGATAATSGKETSGSSSLTLPTLPEKKRQRSASFGASSDIFGGGGDVKVIDLVDTEVIPKDLKPEEPKKDIVRLSTLNCTVCLDSITNMTVTHCGHMFCGECLHIALSGKMFCPVCRNKIENKPKGGGGFTTRQKGYYVLKVKLGKKRSLGKRVAKGGRVEKN